MGTTIRSELSKKNEYWIEKHRYYELKHFCMQYPIWKKLIDYIDSMGHVSDSEIKTKNISDPVLRCVEQREWYISNCKMIERILRYCHLYALIRPSIPKKININQIKRIASIEIM